MGKNIIVGQSGGPTAVINSSLAGVFETAIHLGAENVYGMRYGIEGLLAGNYVDLKNTLKSGLDIELLKRTPSSYLGSCRYKLPDPDDSNSSQVYEKLFSILDKLSVGYLLYIGGNDSMDTINKLSLYAEKKGSDVKFIGIPKTIDNDLCVTDHSPGYGSAAKYISVVTKELICDSTVYDIKSVTIIEIMGRNAGWLTAASALAKGDECDGPDMILLPEIYFDPEKFIAHIDKLQKKKKSLVIAASEGIRLSNGRYVCTLTQQDRKTDVFGHTYLTGTARYLSDLISTQLSIKTRAVELSTLQRCASHIASRTDIDEAYRSGAAAVMAAFKGLTGKMIILNRTSDKPYYCITETHDVSDIANHEKVIPAEWIDLESFNMTQDFTDYAKPLISGEISPIYVEGNTYHIHL